MAGHIKLCKFCYSGLYDRLKWNLTSHNIDVPKIH